MNKEIILLCSGGLGLIVLQNLCQSGHPVSFVFTDKGSTGIVDYCAQNGIGCYAGNPRLPKAKPVIESLHCSILLSVNYLFIVEQDLIDRASDYAINFHGSLLPKYRGRTPHVWAIINAETETGITAHLMTGDVDYGHIVRQVRVPISPDDTGYTVLQKFNTLYPTLVEEVLNGIAQGTIHPTEQDHTKATYFGKRTPDDGAIDWSWQKERIRNWVRAQAKPYPGAFTHYEGEKLTVHAVASTDHGFHYEDPNGLLLETTPNLVVKTPNGALRLTEIETAVTNFEKGKILCPPSTLPTAPSA